MAAEGIRSNLTCPLIAMGRPVGFLFFSSAQVGTYSAEHQEVFLRLADMVSIIVEKSLLYEEMSRLNRDLLLAREQLQRQATHDGLTGLLNHAAIIDALVLRTGEPETPEATVDSPADAGGTDFAALMLDIDHFKSVNDR
ncbi:MAG: GAF domain-containing protein, partial [Actinomycetes bacterium]